MGCSPEERHSSKFCESGEEESSEVCMHLEGFLEEVRSWAETQREYSVRRGVKGASSWGISRGCCCVKGAGRDTPGTQETHWGIT